MVRCLYPLVAEDLDPHQHPEAFERDDPDPNERDPHLARPFDDDNYDPSWPPGESFEVPDTLEDSEDDDAVEDAFEGRDDL